jgi:hypothetical protein
MINKANATQSYNYSLIILFFKVFVNASHLPSRAKSQPHKPKLVKEYACPNALADRLEEGSTGYNKVYKSLGNK